MFRVSAHVLLDLDHEFTRRRHDQRARAAPLPVLDRSGQLGQDRQDERRRLPGTGLRDADDIVSGENVRDGCDLDRSRLGVTRVVHGLEDLGRKMECAKGHCVRDYRRLRSIRIFSSLRGARRISPGALGEASSNVHRYRFFSIVRSNGP